MSYELIGIIFLGVGQVAANCDRGARVSGDQSHPTCSGRPDRTRKDAMTPLTIAFLMLGALTVIGFIVVYFFDRPKGPRREK